MRRRNLFLVDDFETGMAWVLFDHARQRHHLFLVALKHLAKVAAVIGKRAGDPQPLVLPCGMRHDFVHLCRTQTRFCRAEIKQSDQLINPQHPNFDPENTRGA